MPVSTRREDYLAMIGRWTKVRDCYEGSEAVKAKGPVYLPKLDSHERAQATDIVDGQSRYEKYKKRALFFNAVRRTVQGLAGFIFQKPPKVTLPKAIEDQTKDVTLTGMSAETFGLLTTREVIITGRVGVLLDMSVEPAPLQRPYWTMYKAESVVSWRVARIGGDQVLTRVVLCEYDEVPDPKDEYKSVCIEQYRVLVLEDGIYKSRIFRKREGKDDEWYQEGPDLVPQRFGAPFPFIPFVFMTPTAPSEKLEDPPLEDLADVNLSHYRGYADLKHGLHFTALPTPWFSSDKADQKTLYAGSGAAWNLGKGGQAGMLEFTGNGLAAIRQDLEHMQKMMAVLGARLLEDASNTPETATAVSMRHAGEQATLRTIAQSVEQGLSIVAKIHAWWVTPGSKPMQETEASYELNKDYFAIKATPEEIKTALLLLQDDRITYDTFYEILSRGWAREDVTADEEQEQIQKEMEERDALEGSDIVDPNDPNTEIDDPNAAPPEDPNAPPPPPGQKAPPAPPPPPSRRPIPPKKKA